MKSLALALALTGVTVASPPSFAARQTMEVRVRLKKNQGVIDLSGFALRITPPTNFINIVAPPTGINKARIVRKRKGVWSVKIDGQPAQKIHSDQLWVKGQMLRLGVVPVPYDLELHENSKNGVDVIARLDLESYLLGVLPSEMPAAWPLESLKAQAVAARSFVLRKAYERRNQAYDVDSTIIDQVYKFLHEAENHPEWSLKIQRAVRETRGEVLVDHRQRILQAFYSADCGCTTEDPMFVWGKKVAAFQSIQDPTCKLRPAQNWQMTLNRSEVRSRLIAALKLPTSSTLKTLHVGGRTPSGRVSQVIAAMEVDGKARSLPLNSQDFRRIFGFNRIRSTDFSLRWLGEELEINGTGIGHGVGMCQTGAKSLATEGRSYREILKLYYPKAQLWTLKRT